MRTNDPRTTELLTADDTATGAPLSYGQEQLWFLDQLAPGETTYNLLLAWRLRGALDVELLRRCLNLIVERHEVLRVTVQAANGTPYQVVAPATEVALPITDLTALPAEEQDAAVQASMADQTNQVFDLETGPLYRYRLLKLADDHYVFCQNFHHLVTDGWSSAVMNAEITAAYQALLDGREPFFDELEMDYPEFAGWQRERLDEEELADELRFWQEKLADLPVLELPTDRPRPATANHRGATVIRAFSPEVLERARTLAQEHGASLFMVLAAAFNVVLSRYSGQEDIPVGVPMLGRVEPELEDVVGLFINMVVLRSDLSGDPSFAELLERTADANLELYEHQEVPFHQVVDRVQPARDPGRNPLFQVAVQLLGGSENGENLFFQDVESEYVLLPSVRSRFDITLNFIEGPESLKASVEYSADLFDRWRIEAMLGHIENVLAHAAKDPSLALSELSVLTAAEQQELRSLGRGEVVPYADQPLHVGLARLAAERPDATAVVCRGVELSYGELDRRADRFARFLRARGVTAGQVVGVLLDRDLDAYVAMLGVLKAGAAYAMMDPKAPAARVDFMLRDTDAPLVVTRSGFAGLLPESTGWATLLIDTEWDAVEAMPAEEPLAEWATPESLAYILYTSGSTGMPKGVMIPHQAVSVFAESYRRTFGFGPQDRLLQQAALTFDMSQGEIWTAFLVGAALVAVAPEEAETPESLAAVIRDERVSFLGLSPAMLSLLDAGPYPDLRYVMAGGEVLPAEVVNKWNLPGRSMVNLYGPTETAVACTEYICEHRDWQSSPPIGHPQPNRQLYVVDRWGNLAPRGVPGELLIGGDNAGLAHGYLKRPELTAEKFVADPFDPALKVYRSGDLVRWNADGQIEYIGRIDTQVKLRGLRIELGEIEAALQSHPAVKLAVVLMRPDARGENHLVGYYTADGEAPQAEQLRAHLTQSLPEYMVPTAWVAMDEFPISGNGWKINRKALPDPVDTDQPAVEYLAPRTPTEEGVAQIYAEVLSLPQVGCADSFFTIGGNSLQAMRVVSKLKKQFGIKINIRLLYGNAEVGALAAAIDEKLGLAAAG